MEQFREVLLDVWREACRHIEISESTATIAAMLTKHLPLEFLLVRRLDMQHSCLDTVAVGCARGSACTAASRTLVPEARWKRLLSWARKGALLDAPPRGRVGEAALVVPPELDGEALAGALRGPDGPAGVVVAVAEPAKQFRAQHRSMMEALREPFSAALENDRRLHELAALREAAEADRRSLLTRLGRSEMQSVIVGAEAGLRPVMERVQLVAQSDVPVLILGQTGTGKEVVAREIHQRSVRGAGPFIRVNCGAIPPELIDSQLFGHERGSFTGASDTRHGWFERADGGTLFLDEIGELPLPAQVRLLRVLQDGYIERVGGQQPIHVDVRMVAATHCDLAAMVQARTFREDVWYRIAVFPILLPRLNERREDIPALARHFAQRAARRFGLPLVEPTADDVQVLMRYPWPGNIRELGAVIDRAAILGDGKKLEVIKSLGAGALPTSVSSAAAAPPAAPTADGAPPLSAGAGDTSLPTLDEAQRQSIERALAATRGRIEGPHGAAALLRINPHTLRARMRKLGIDWSRFRAPAII